MHTASGRDWRVSAGGFWQVHPGAADTLADAVLAALRPRPGDAALDLYCGAGLLAGVVAAAVGKEGTVIGVESDAAAVRDARRNLRTVPWARIHRGSTARVLARGGWPPIRLAVLDPPRAGAGRQVIGSLRWQGLSGSPTYPATLARWPETSPRSPGRAGNCRRCARSTRSR
jgi:tRNA/tmRNA/rRNA uracil-C5-methylase (TrmA/RlmC/RlmD family)